MFKLLKSFNKKDVLFIFICILMIVFQVWLDLKLPDYMSNITVLVQTKANNINMILKEGFYMLLCALGSLISAIIVGYFASYLSASFSLNLRKKIFTKVQKFSLNEIKKFETSSLITRTTNDVTQIEMFIAMGLQVLIKAPIMAIWAILKIVNKNIEWSMLTGGCVIVLLMTVNDLKLMIYITLAIIATGAFFKINHQDDKEKEQTEKSTII